MGKSVSMDAVHGFPVTYTSNTVFCNLLLKLEVVLLLEISGLKEFQSVTVRGMKLYLNTSDCCWGNEVTTFAQFSVVSRRFKVVWQGDSNFMVYGFVEDQRTSNTGFSRKTI